MSERLPFAKAELKLAPLNPRLFAEEIDSEFVRSRLPNRRQAERYQCLPLRHVCNEEDGTESIEVAMVNPYDPDAAEFVERILGAVQHGQLLVVRKVDVGLLHRAIDFVFVGLDAQDEDEEDIAVEFEQRRENETDILVEKPDDAQSIRKIRAWLREAVNSGASDIHFEPFADGARIRQRQDGVLLKKASSINDSTFRQIVAWLKIQAGKRVEVTRRPQDGSFNIGTKTRRIDVRFSSIPTVHGEKVVLRFLYADAVKQSLVEVIFKDDLRAMFSKAIHATKGIVLVTGPTGSGKTTTLQAALRELHNRYQDEKNIVTVEDPVEYQIAGLNQVQVNHEMPFGTILRHIVRQDPDIIMIGEIRDDETAAIAVQAALTGHLVLSSLHTNDAIGSISRMRDLNVRPYLIASTVILMQAQRLIRRLCPHCVQEMGEAEVANVLKGTPVEHWIQRLMGKTIRKAAINGCNACENTGFIGRDAIMEVLEVTPALRPLIESERTLAEVHAEAVKNGFKSMSESGFELIVQGTTTLSEVLAYVSDTDRSGEKGATADSTCGVGAIAVPATPAVSIAVPGMPANPANGEAAGERRSAWNAVSPRATPLRRAVGSPMRVLVD